MDARFDELLQHSQRDVRGPDANEALWNARTELTREYGRAIAYELVIAQDDPVTWTAFVEERMPKLRAYLDSKGESAVPGPHVLISAWAKDRLYIFDGPSFWGAVAAIEDVSPKELSAKLRSDGPGDEPSDLPMLPAPKSDDSKDN